jgi:amino acid transporter
MLGEEVKNPNRTLPLSVLLSFATSATIYICARALQQVCRITDF